MKTTEIQKDLNEIIDFIIEKSSEIPMETPWGSIITDIKHKLKELSVNSTLDNRPFEVKRLETMVSNASHYLCNTDDLESIVIQLLEIEDTSQSLDYCVDRIEVCEASENDYTVKSFIELIDTYHES